MALVKRHWKLALFNLLLILGVGVWIAQRVMHTTVGAQVVNGGGGGGGGGGGAPGTQPTPLDPLTLTRMAELRRSLALENRDLAALGCSQQQASQVLSALLSWYQANTTGWSQAEAAEQNAWAALQEANHSINVGPKNPTLLAQRAGLKQGLTSARLARQTFFESANSSVSGNLNGNQSTTWGIAKANRDLLERYRYAASISAGNARKLTVALLKYGQSAEAVRSLESSLLGANPAAALNSIEATVAGNIDAVLTAEAQTLPAPTPTLAIRAQ
jgi:hypothetical protein